MTENLERDADYRPATADYGLAKTEPEYLDTHHPEVPSASPEAYGWDRLVSENRSYSQAHWRDEHRKAQDRAEALRAAAQAEVDDLDRVLSRLTLERQSWVDQVVAHEMTVTALTSVAKELEQQGVPVTPVQPLPDETARARGGRQPVVTDDEVAGRVRRADREAARR